MSLLWDGRDGVERVGVNWYRIFSVFCVAMIVCMGWYIYNNQPAKEQPPRAKIIDGPDVIAAKKNEAASPSNTSTDTNPCDDVLSRSEEIDADSHAETQGPVQDVDFRHISPEYKQLKQCWRKEKIGSESTSFSYYGEVQGLRLGMTPKEFGHVLPVLPAKLRGTDTTGTPDVFDWIPESCNAAPEKSSPAAIMICTFRRPSTYFPAVREYTHAPFPDTITAFFDKLMPDGKLLSWSLETSVPVESYKTTDEVIRYQRQEGLRALGPPDIANSHEAEWFFTDDHMQGLFSVSLTVHRIGDAFASDLSVTGDNSGALTEAVKRPNFPTGTKP